MSFQKKVDFIGRDALLRQKEHGIKRMYIQLIVDDHDLETDLWPWGGEPIFRNDKFVGMTTTTGYGHTFKKQVNMDISIIIYKCTLWYMCIFFSR